MELVMEKYVQKTGQCQFNAKFLRKIKIQFALNKHRKTKCCPYCPFTEPEKATMVQKLTLHVDKFHRKELRVLNLQRINKEIEDLEEGRETDQTETELKKKTEEREGQSHSLLLSMKVSINTTSLFSRSAQNFESKLIVARDPTVAENPSAYDFAPCPSCLGFFQKLEETQTTWTWGKVISRWIFSYSWISGNNQFALEVLGTSWKKNNVST